MSFSIELNYRIAQRPADFIFNVHAARTHRQIVVREQLQVSPSASIAIQTEAATGSRFVRLTSGPGDLLVRYSATVDIDHHFESPQSIAEIGVSCLPLPVIAYLYPSRYCQSDRLYALASAEFGHLAQGYARVQAISDWVRTRTLFRPASSNSSTSALDTIVEKVGVCRDFAHLMIALCRAVNIPARFVSGIDYGADPALGPTDFHAYVDVYLGDRWYLFDPSGVSPPMGLVRIGTGRDAADVSFATIFGAVQSSAPVISIEAHEDPAAGFYLPRFVAAGLSTHA